VHGGAGEGLEDEHVEGAGQEVGFGGHGSTLDYLWIESQYIRVQGAGCRVQKETTPPWRAKCTRTRMGTRICGDDKGFRKAAEEQAKCGAKTLYLRPGEG
jgi:hypothetical protein